MGAVERASPQINYWLMPCQKNGFVNGPGEGPLPSRKPFHVPSSDTELSSTELCSIRLSVKGLAKNV